jgi:hypothetical protein
MTRVVRGAFLFALLAGMAPASAEEWVSRHGACYEWEGRWDVQQEQSGVWVGGIDLAHAGGPCSAGTDGYYTNEVRAVIVGGDFFARRTTGSAMCYLHGQIRGAEIRGWEMCNGSAAPTAFAVRLSPPQAR